MLILLVGSTSWGWVGALGGAWAALALCLLGLALCWLRLRSRRLADEKVMLMLLVGSTEWD